MQNFIMLLCDNIVTSKTLQDLVTKSVSFTESPDAINQITELPMRPGIAKSAQQKTFQFQWNTNFHKLVIELAKTTVRGLCPRFHESI